MWFLFIHPLVYLLCCSWKSCFPTLILHCLRSAGWKTATTASSSRRGRSGCSHSCRDYHHTNISWTGVCCDKKKRNSHPGWIWSVSCICSSVILSNSFCVWLTGRVRLTAWRKPGWVHLFTKISPSHIWISVNMLTLGPGFRLSVRLWRRITIIFRGNSWKIRERWTFWGRHWKRRGTTSTSWWRKPGKYLLFAQNMLEHHWALF